MNDGMGNSVISRIITCSPLRNVGGCNLVDASSEVFSPTPFRMLLAIPLLSKPESPSSSSSPSPEPPQLVRVC